MHREGVHTFTRYASLQAYLVDVARQPLSQMQAHLEVRLLNKSRVYTAADTNKYQLDQYHNAHPILFIYLHPIWDFANGIAWFSIW